MPRTSYEQVYERGRYAEEFFNRHGELRHIKSLRFWPLDRVLSEKYHFPRHEVRVDMHVGVHAA
jgi:hypothetical protein